MDQPSICGGQVSSEFSSLDTIDHKVLTSNSKTSRLKIETDQQFDFAVTELFRGNINKANFCVHIKFDLDSLAGWRIRGKKVCLSILSCAVTSLNFR
jgi:hypothetical protein